MTSQPSAVTAGDGDRPSRREVLTVFIALMLAMLLASLDQTIVSTALPTITGELHGLNHLSWVVIGYLVATTVVMPVYGKLGDLFGRKRVFLFAIVVFLAGSALCGTARSMDQLIAFRCLQGLGGGGLMIVAQAIISDLVGQREVGRYMGLMGAVIGVASVAGPLAGGLIVDHFSWRWIFYVNIPIGLVTLLVVASVLKPTPTQARPRIDYVGMLLAAAAVTCLVLFTSLGGTTYPWGSPQIIGLAAAVVALIPVWLFTEHRASEPMIPLSLYRDSIFTFCGLISLGFGFVLFGTVAYLPTFLQIVIGVTATNSGVLMLPMMAGLILASILAGQLVSRTGHYKPFPIAGTAVAMLGLGLLSTMTADTTRPTASIFMFVLGAGVGLAMQVAVIAAQNTVPREHLGTATATTTFTRQIGSCLGTAIVGSLFTHRLSQNLASVRTGQLHVRASSITPATLDKLPAAAQHLVVEAFAHALPPIYAYLIPIMAAAFVCSLLLKEKPLRPRGPIANPEPQTARTAGQE